MRLGEILVARGLATVEDIERATERQREIGGRLGDNLVALGIVTPEQMDGIIHATPQSPRSLAETGIPANSLTGLMMKFMYLQPRETAADLVDALRLPLSVVRTLVEEASQKKLIQAMGGAGGGIGVAAQIRYALTDRGREAANEALARNLYIGPAPVSLPAFQEQVLKQRITNEVVDQAAIRQCFANLVIPDHFLRKIGPAINAGRTILLYGPPGNGKTSIATRVSKIFRDVVYIPYAVEIDGQILQVYDPSVHVTAVNKEEAEELATREIKIRRDEFDRRWVACQRPVVVVGGELTLEMLDLSYNDEAKFYEAPMHVKALNGTFIIDDFGRQIVSPEALLNRWIVPMESRIDFLKLNTGKSFYLPFDALLIFSTNMAPDDLMDPAFLRRIPYKIELYEPSREDFRTIFAAIAKGCGLTLTDDVFEFVVHELEGNKYHLAYYQPKFICDQVIAACKYEGVQPEFTIDRVADALTNLYVHIKIGAGEGRQANITSN